MYSLMTDGSRPGFISFRGSWATLGGSGSSSYYFYLAGKEVLAISRCVPYWWWLVCFCHSLAPWQQLLPPLRPRRTPPPPHQLLKRRKCTCVTNWGALSFVFPVRPLLSFGFELICVFYAYHNDCVISEGKEAYLSDCLP